MRVFVRPSLLSVNSVVLGISLLSSYQVHADPTPTPAPTPTATTTPAACVDGGTGTLYGSAYKTDVRRSQLSTELAALVPVQKAEFALQEKEYTANCVAKPGCAITFGPRQPFPDPGSDPKVTLKNPAQCLQVGVNSTGATANWGPETMVGIFEFSDTAHKRAYSEADDYGKKLVADSPTSCNDANMSLVVLQNWWKLGDYTTDCKKGFYSASDTWKCSGYLYKDIECCLDSAVFDISREESETYTCK